MMDNVEETHPIIVITLDAIVQSVLPMIPLAS